VSLISDPSALERLDAALSEWRQGDIALDEHWFTFVADGAIALTPESAAAGEGLQAITVDVEGLVVITQSCDIVRSSRDRPFVEVSPLVQVPPSALVEIERGRRPAYAIVPAVKDRSLVVDLDRVMTVEKAVVASWKRTDGCVTERQGRDLARALARKRARPAFPDDFVGVAAKLLKRLQGKHDKDSDEGRALRALREIRVRAAPAWTAEKVDITFWYIPESDAPDFEGRDWHEYLAIWQKLVVPTGRFVKVSGVVRSLEDLTAKDYVDSDPLDLDHLSSREPSADTQQNITTSLCPSEDDDKVLDASEAKPRLWSVLSRHRRSRRHKSLRPRQFRSGKRQRRMDLRRPPRFR